MIIDTEIFEPIIRTAGRMILDAHISASDIHQKEGLANFCTEYDMNIQRYLIAELGKVLPGASFYGEEDTEGNSGAQASGEYTFYIDPIDGTTNFMFGYHHSCVSVGLAHEGKMIAGFVYNPYVDEMYVGIRGEGSWLNGKKLQMKNVPVEEGIVAFGCARYNEGDTDALFEIVKTLYLRSLSVRNGGSAALDICRVASGNNAAYVELKLQPYDYAAASLIVEEAGGKIAQIDGSPLTLDAPCPVICGTPTAWDEVQKVVQTELMG